MHPPGDINSKRQVSGMILTEENVSKLSIPHGALVFVGDGQKALFLRNFGDEKLLNLIAERVFTDKNPPTHEQGSDRPGRGFKRAATNRRTAMEETDWHELEKSRFADRVAFAMDQLVRAEKAKAVIIVAPPRTLAELRHALHADVKRRIIAEVDKDLTKHPVWDIEKHLVGC
jgi:protein required for attachment to host cells